MTDNKFVCNKMQCFGTRRMIYLFTVRDIYALTKKYCFNTIFSLEYFILCPLNPQIKPTILFINRKSKYQLQHYPRQTLTLVY